MSESKPRLTINDPVPSETMKTLTELNNIKARMGVRMAELELEKINVLSAIKKTEDQRQRIFGNILVERGLAPGTPVEIDLATGALSLLQERAPEKEADTPTEASSTPSE